MKKVLIFVLLPLLLLLILFIFPSKETIASSHERQCPSFAGTEPLNPTINDDITIVFSAPVNGQHTLMFDNDKNKIFNIITGNKIGVGKLNQGKRNFKLSAVGLSGSSFCYEVSFTVNPPSGPPAPPGAPGKNPCEGGVCKTALGDIPTDPAAFAQKVLEIAVGLGGGLALILMVVGAIKVLTSTGDQQKLTGGRDMIVAAVAGLLFIIFSMLILRFIGLKIFGGGLVG